MKSSSLKDFELKLEKKQIIPYKAAKTVIGGNGDKIKKLYDGTASDWA